MTTENSHQIEGAVDQLLREMIAELHPDVSIPAIQLDSSIQEDLGMDSLARTELLTRLEELFHVQLQDQQIVSAETVMDLVLAIQTSENQSSSATVVSNVADLRRNRTGLLSTPDNAATLIDVLEWRARAEPNRILIQFYSDDDRLIHVTAKELFTKARQVAMGVRRLGLPAHPIVALMLPTSLEFIYCFYGIIMAGGIPVPLYPPSRPTLLEEHIQRQLRILTNCKASLLVAPVEARPLESILRSMLPDLLDIVRPQKLLSSSGEFEKPVLNGSDIAFLQYTSGSTGAPKGVILTHSNLLANIRAMGSAIRAGPSDIFVSWLPLYHDMGLIGACMATLYFNVPLVLMSPLRFIARPERWLWLIHENRGTLSAAPNFAFEVCCRKIRDSQLAGLDLSSWRVAFNGSEPVSASTLHRFADRFKAYGFRPEALTPVYGLAESSVGLAFPPLGRGPRIDSIVRDAFLKQNRAVPASAKDSTAIQMVSCGAPLPKHEVRVVDESDRELGERAIGRIQFRGPSSTSGYYRNPRTTRALFHEDWLDTSDYGYFANGEVFVTGRAKDLIIHGGQHVFPYESERLIGDLPEIRKGGVALLGKSDPKTGTEQIVVIAETRLPEARKNAALRARIQQLVLDSVGILPDDIVLAPPYSVPKTPNGKLRRTDCLRLYERGELGRARPLWLQWLRLRFSSFLPSFRRSLRWTKVILYGCYFYFILGILCVPAMAAILLFPRLSWRISITAFLLRLGWVLTRTSIQVFGLKNVDPNMSRIIVSNHASYMDSLLVASVLPGPFRFVAKLELKRIPILGLILRRLGCIFVERFDPQSATEDVSVLIDRIRQQGTIILFPEGTFTRAPGLRPFHMGAFLSAARTGVALLPVTLEGTRSMLRAGWFFPRRSRIRIHVSTPVFPKDSDWREAIRLRNQVRAEMLLRCGEPDLGQ